MVVGGLFWRCFILFKMQAVKIIMKKYIKPPEDRLIHASYKEGNSALDKKVYVFYIVQNYVDALGILYLYSTSKIINMLNRQVGSPQERSFICITRCFKMCMPLKTTISKRELWGI